MITKLQILCKRESENADHSARDHSLAVVSIHTHQQCIIMTHSSELQARGLDHKQDMS